MVLNLITLATVKTQLGISDGTYDASITAMIPIVSNDVRRILNCNFDQYLDAGITSGSDSIAIYSGLELLTMGQVVANSSAITADTYIQAYDPSTLTYTMSANAIADATYLYPTLEISQWPTVSKMIFYKISKQTTNAATTALYQSIRYGNVSKTFAPDEINKKYDYPEIFIRDLGTPFAKVG